MAEGWLIETPEAIKQKAAQLQAHLAHLRWLRPIPDHFLHVWFGGPVTLGGRPSEWRGTGAFDITYEGINCFHSAVVVEAHAQRFHELIEGTDLDPATFLPHMTIAVTTQEHDPGELRDVLVPLHETRLGTDRATEAKRVRFPAGRTTLFQPWDVLETVLLGERAL